MNTAMPYFANFILAIGLVALPLSGYAAPDGFDLDLKELKKPTTPQQQPKKQASGKKEISAPQAVKAQTKKVKSVQKAVKAAPEKAEKPAVRTPATVAAVTAAPAATAQSSYIVKTGETLFTILTNNYHLSQEAAKQLTPRILLMNRLNDVRSIGTGQRLLIPLPAPKVVASAPPQTPAPTVPAAPPIPAPAAPPATPVRQIAQTGDPHEQFAFIDAVTACPLARQTLEAVADPLIVAEVLNGLQIPTAVAAGRFSGITAVLACDLPTAESYTFRRLLQIEGVQLISLEGDEDHNSVVHLVARELGLSLTQLSESPLTYRIIGQNGHPIRLTVRTGAAH